MEILAYQFREEIRCLVREEMAAIMPTIEPEKEPALPAEITNQQGICERLGVSEPTIIRWRNKGKIPFIRIGSAVRYDVNAVIKALEGGKKKKGANS